MTSYKVFLSKSADAAEAIAHGFSCDMENSGIKSVQYGCTDCDAAKKLIPEIYQVKEYFYCAVKFEETEHFNSVKYELIIC